MIKKLIRRLIRWAFAGEKGSFVINVGAEINIDRRNVEEILVRGASTSQGRKVITNTIRRAKINNEL